MEFVYSKANLVPIFHITHQRPAFDVLDKKANILVEYREDSRKYKVGNLMEEPVPEEYIILDSEENINLAAKKLMEFRPLPDRDHPAAVIFREDFDQAHTWLEWYRIDHQGRARAFANADPAQIPENEGERFNETSHYLVYFSPVSAIKAVKEYLDDTIKTIKADMKKMEDEFERASNFYKPLIDKIINAQKF